MEITHLITLLGFQLAMSFGSAATLIHGGLGSGDEVRLVHHLFTEQGYNPLIRPVKNLTDTIDVSFGMAMVQLISVDEKNQIMKSNVWLRMAGLYSLGFPKIKRLICKKSSMIFTICVTRADLNTLSNPRGLPITLWYDYQLKWDPADFGGITVIRMLAQNVWKPDIVLFNNADGKYEVSYQPNVVIYNTGMVLWIPPAIYKSSCPIDVKYFPFDEQRCQMKFSSWTFSGDQVSLSWYEGSEKVDISDYVNSGTWDIVACPGVYNNTWDAAAGQHQAQITFTLYIRRKTLFYTVNLIIPCVLISFLSLSVFYLPADAGEKMTMCISILLALVVFLLLVSKILPPTSNSIPLIARYLLFTFIMNIITIFVTVIIINWNFRTPRTHRLSTRMRTIFLYYLPKILFMTRPSYDDRWAKKAYTQKMRRSACPDITTPRRVSSLLGGGDASRGTRTTTPGGVSFCSEDPAGNPIHISLSADHKTAIDAVKFIASHLKNEDDYAEVLEDWRYIAMVIDRLQLYVFLAVTIGGTAAILTESPNTFAYIDQDEVKRKIIASSDGYVHL